LFAIITRAFATPDSFATSDAFVGPVLAKHPGAAQRVLPIGGHQALPRGSTGVRIARALGKFASSRAFFNADLRGL
jgi:hypothetical protein